jgi:hypothetical protein
VGRNKIKVCTIYFANFSNILYSFFWKVRITDCVLLNLREQNHFLLLGAVKVEVTRLDISSGRKSCDGCLQKFKFNQESTIWKTEWLFTAAEEINKLFAACSTAYVYIKF